MKLPIDLRQFLEARRIDQQAIQLIELHRTPVVPAQRADPPEAAPCGPRIFSTTVYRGSG